MTRDELMEKLSSIEWNDIEFKEASFEVPKTALETVSAFANTRGGHIVFGVKEGSGGDFTVTGVTNDKVASNFLGQIRNSQKINVTLSVTDEYHSFPEGKVMCFHIPEASKEEKPVYLDGNPKKTYVRKGESNYQCSGGELQRFFRDSGNTPYDSETLDLDPETFFSAETLRWYRSRFKENKPGIDETVDNVTFLRNRGLLIEEGGQLQPTRAAVLIFGTVPYVNQKLRRMVVDLQLYRHSSDEYSSTIKWSDRLEVENNLIEAWKEVLDFFQRHSERPFSVDPATLRRDDDPPDYSSFREAAINLLIHQDFGDATRNPVIRIFKDKTEFFNPGDAFDSPEKLLDPGGKQNRNPSIVNVFRWIGLSEQAGSGMATIFESWRRLGYLPPEIENDKADKSFRLRLRRERLRSEKQLLFQASLGVQLPEEEAAVFAFLIWKGEADLADVKALTGLSGPAARKLVQRLAAQVIIKQTSYRVPKWVLAPQLQESYGHGEAEDTTEKQEVRRDFSREYPPEQVTEQVGKMPTGQVGPLRELSSAQWAIVTHADVPRSLVELMRIAGYTQRPHFKAAHMEPLITGKILRMTVPDKPTSSKQRYVLTPAGLELKALRLEIDAKKPRQEDAE